MRPSTRDVPPIACETELSATTAVGVAPRVASMPFDEVTGACAVASLAGDERDCARAYSRRTTQAGWCLEERTRATGGREYSTYGATPVLVGSAVASAVTCRVAPSARLTARLQPKRPVVNWGRVTAVWPLARSESPRGERLRWRRGRSRFSPCRGCGAPGCRPRVVSPAGELGDRRAERVAVATDPRT